MNICNDCGYKNTAWTRSAVEATIRGSTYHLGLCEWCGQEKGVTDSRHYGVIFKNKTYKDKEHDPRNG